MIIYYFFIIIINKRRGQLKESMTENNIKLFKAVRYGTPPLLAMKRVIDYIKQGTDPNLILYKNYIEPDPQQGHITSHTWYFMNCTLVMVAVTEGHLHILKTLIENGAQYDYRNETLKNPIDTAAIIWYRTYGYKNILQKKTQSRLKYNHNYKNVHKYTTFWPSDEELKAYRIFKYLLRMGARLTIHEEVLARNIKKKFIDREIRQRLTDRMFEEVINENTNSNIGTCIVREQKSILENYLLFSDILW